MPEGKYSSTIKITKLPGLDYSEILSMKDTYKRSKIKIKEATSNINFDILAEDAVALRASINAVMRNIEIIEKAYRARV
jgi:tRNA threonylcarbamoyladenosine modification (KEOPS) complex  Pcc1 subunit